jgi:hypothetical protein
VKLQQATHLKFSASPSKRASVAKIINLILTTVEDNEIRNVKQVVNYAVVIDDVVYYAVIDYSVIIIDDALHLGKEVFQTGFWGAKTTFGKHPHRAGHYK